MRKMVEHLVNVIHKEELEMMFGVGSKITINKVKYITNQKKFLIESTLSPSIKSHENLNEEKINDFISFYPDGVNLLLSESWKFIGLKENLIFLNNIK